MAGEPKKHIVDRTLTDMKLTKHTLNRKATEEKKWHTHTLLSRIWRYRSDAGKIYYDFRRSKFGYADLEIGRKP